MRESIATTLAVHEAAPFVFFFPDIMRFKDHFKKDDSALYVFSCFVFPKTLRFPIPVVLGDAAAAGTRGVKAADAGAGGRRTCQRDLRRGVTQPRY